MNFKNLNSSSNRNLSWPGSNEKEQNSGWLVRVEPTAVFIPWIVMNKMAAGPNSFLKFWMPTGQKKKHLKLTNIIFCNWKLGYKLSF